METPKRNEEFEALMKSSQETKNEAIAYLKEKGIDFQPGQWLTIKRYCNKFGIADTQTVTNWIEQRVIPPENVVLISEFQNTIMIKAVPYDK